MEPLQNFYFIGHEDAEHVLLNAWKNNALHNSWLISGLEGVGKATLAYRFARFLLAADEKQKASYHSLDIAENHPVFRLAANRSHPDLKIIERDYIETDKKKVIKAIKDGDALDDEQLGELKKSAVIKIDEVRTINEFLSKKSFEGRWRIVIVDSVDDLNSAGANAILKILEEPPAKSILLLISHNPNRLLPTIRSRCAKLNLAPLQEDQVCSLLRRYRPETLEKDIKGLAHLSSGSIGKALNYADHQGLVLYQSLEQLFNEGATFNVMAALDLCEQAARDENIWSLMIGFIRKFLTDSVKNNQQSLRNQKMKHIGAAWDKINQTVLETAGLNMDKKQAMLNIITTVCKAI